MDDKDFSGDYCTVPSGHARAILHNVEDHLSTRRSLSDDWPDAGHDGFKTVYRRYREVVPKQQWNSEGFQVDGKLIESPADMDVHYRRARAYQECPPVIDRHDQQRFIDLPRH